VEPTLFVGPKSDAEMLNQEIFGPVAVISSLSAEEEALELCNKSSYGLNAGVYTSDINKALRFADALESGRVGINCVNESSFSVPFGGTKQSGQGRELGLEGIKSWLEMKSSFIDIKQ
jgi:acyl-CoA reductase-like NAD-dependent aldehyde dehydrogenase